MEKLNKKAQVGQTLTWVIATIIVFFLLFIFIIITGLLVAKKNLFGQNNVDFQQTEALDMSTLKSFEGFVNSDISGKIVYDIVADASSGILSKEFKDNAKIFLELNFPDNQYVGARINIYNIFGQEEEFSDYSSKYGNCDASKERSVVYSYYSRGNKISLCVERKT